MARISWKESPRAPAMRAHYDGFVYTYLGLNGTGPHHAASAGALPDDRDIGFDDSDGNGFGGNGFY